jgi:hypothetical protein
LVTDQNKVATKKRNNSKNIGDSSSNISQSAEKGLWQLLHSVA